MNRWSKVSAERLETCHESLQELANVVLQRHDCTVICGHRTQGQQERAFIDGLSKVQWPNSRHNSYPSLAIDLAPYPIDWADTKRFYFFAGIVLSTALELGIKIRWGGDWDSDLDLNDQTFMDLVHFELVGE